MKRIIALLTLLILTAVIWLTTPIGALIVSKPFVPGPPTRLAESNLDATNEMTPRPFVAGSKLAHARGSLDMTSDEQAMLALVFRMNFFGKTLPPEAGISISAETRAHLKRRFLAAGGVAVDRLLERYARLNQKSIRLSIPPDRYDAYSIDYERQLTRCGPVASLPAYDPETGLVVVYVARDVQDFYGCGTWQGPEGWFILYRHDGGTLQELKRVTLYYSFGEFTLR